VPTLSFGALCNPFDVCVSSSTVKKVVKPKVALLEWSEWIGLKPGMGNEEVRDEEMGK